MHENNLNYKILILDLNCKTFLIKVILISKKLTIFIF
jgi:hypothetical protein